MVRIYPYLHKLCQPFCLKRFIFGAMFIVVLLALPFCSKASCTSYSPGNINFDLGVVDVPNSTPVGTVLKIVTITAPPAGSTGCTLGETDGFSKYVTGNPTGMKYKENDIYSTNIPGVGFAICYFSCDSSTAGGWYPFVTYNNVLHATYLEFGNLPWSFVLVATGEINESGPLTHGEYGEVGLGNTAVGKIFLTSGTIKATECNLEKSDVFIDFGGLQASQFIAPGTTTQEKSFNIGLTCNAAANINVTLEGQQSGDSSDPSILALSNMGQQGVATGLGVQIIYNGNPLEINKKIPLKTTEGNIIETFPFSARYYQTKSVVTPGEANVVATLSITHQ
ncbi:fimbrial protein [Lelliottia amnigena]